MQSNLETALSIELEIGKISGFAMEYKFHPTRRWRFDFCWPQDDIMLAVEVEGGTWSGGRHTRGSGFEKDCEKYNEAALLGYTVLRVTADQVRNGKAFNWIERYLIGCEKMSGE